MAVETGNTALCHAQPTPSVHDQIQRHGVNIDEGGWETDSSSVVAETGSSSPTLEADYNPPAPDPDFFLDPRTGEFTYNTRIVVAYPSDEDLSLYGTTDALSLPGNIQLTFATEPVLLSPRTGQARSPQPSKTCRRQSTGLQPWQKQFAVWSSPTRHSGRESAPSRIPLPATPSPLPP